ncbi:unnamed protein product [Vitrella brassicaformis CCMP3155]|uniref:Uncharacterized protein n=1 Tax=Vitrella brassicaformis (strain CCMP3155) TaxID=1169540 RepID=A0A0G4GBA1_VITBC|nr:unnamed protein product [Vitrella brassicaformis CCMP3155]|mmetsp:Transcript_31625/g.78339  ORF Transcript_31625/g.78339 Transcript_31625/m.78339 type:complete len:188 (-) Transcript_31625:578-1141(-)|eukprot:CEM25945.1 unnamed protein product [Vitrella brassicaformis CCMP3155]
MTDIESGGKIRTTSEATDRGFAHGHHGMKLSSAAAIVALVVTAAVAVAALVVGAVALQKSVAQETATDGVMVHMTAGPEEQHRVLMALSMANRMANMGKDVIVFCDVDCPPLMAKSAEDFAVEAFEGNVTKDDLLGRLLAKGVPIHVCPGCLTKHGLSMEDVRDGVNEVDANEFFAFTDGRMLHFDY